MPAGTGRHRCDAASRTRQIPRPENLLVAATRVDLQVTVPTSAPEWTTRREYRLATTGNREARRHQRHVERRDFARRIVPAVVAATVLLGAGQVLIAQGSVETADADTVALSAFSGQITASARKPATSVPPRTAPAASRSATRFTLEAAEVQQRGATLEADAAVTSTLAANAEVEQGVREQARKAAFTAPIEGASITSGYGQRWGRMHHGMDFGAEIGHPLYAVTEAKVTTASYNSGLGHHVRITLADGTEVSYGHLSKISVEAGDIVEPGTEIGRVGNSGSSTGAHLHFEVRGPDGESVDPRPWLTERGLL